MAPGLRESAHDHDGAQARGLNGALNLLEILGGSSDGLTISQLSRELRMPKSSAHYLMRTLALRGYVLRGIDGHRYFLGPSAFDFASLTFQESELRRICAPHAKRLATKSNTTAHVGVRRGRQGVIIGKWDSQGWLGGAWVGCSFYLHGSGLGKALLAYLPESELEIVFGGRPLTQVTPNTILSVEFLKAHLAKVRAQGYAVNNEEDSLGAKSVAAPIFNHLGEAVASICAHAPVAQIPGYRISELAKKVIAAANDISRELAG